MQGRYAHPLGGVRFFSTWVKTQSVLELVQCVQDGNFPSHLIFFFLHISHALAMRLFLASLVSSSNMDESGNMCAARSWE
jgi:hypothetical protein